MKQSKNKMKRRYKTKYKNQIKLYRRRMGFSQRRVATLLGHQDSSTLSAFEGGRVLPTLPAALKLGIILRIPVEFLFPDTYDRYREEIRAHEETLEEYGPSHPEDTVL